MHTKLEEVLPTHHFLEHIISRIFFRPLAEMVPVVPKLAEFGQKANVLKHPQDATRKSHEV